MCWFSRVEEADVQRMEKEDVWPFNGNETNNDETTD